MASPGPSKFSLPRLAVFALVFGLLGVVLWQSYAAPNPNQPGDLSGDNTVDATDLSILLSDFGTTNVAADIDASGSVDVIDLSILLSHYGQSYTPPGGVVVQPPQAPAAYTLPGGAVSVSTTAELSSAVSGGTQDIILENGDYSNSASLNIGTHRLWARNLGGATLHFGLQMGGNASGTGAEVHGLKFNVTDPAATFQSSIINVWGNAGANSVIKDSWFYGNMAVGSGIMDRKTSGFDVERVVVNGFIDYGIFFETYYPDYYTDNPAVVPVVTDADISQIYNTPRGSSNGTAEAGLWAGTDCGCSRIKVRDTGWMGIWTGGNANNGVYSDFDIDDIYGDDGSGNLIPGIAVYLEHYSRSNVFKDFVIGSTGNTGISVGFNCEWADPGYAGTNPVAGQSIAGCHFNTMQDGTIYSTSKGFSLEDAESTTIKNITFVGQSVTAIKDFMSGGSGQTTVWEGQGNDFSGLAPGASQYSTAH